MKLTVAGAVCPPLRDEDAGRTELLDAVVSHIGYVHVAGRIDSNTVGVRGLLGVRGPAAAGVPKITRCKSSAGWVELFNARRFRIGYVQVPGRIHGDVPERIESNLVFRPRPLPSGRGLSSERRGGSHDRDRRNHDQCQKHPEYTIIHPVPPLLVPLGRIEHQGLCAKSFILPSQSNPAPWWQDRGAKTLEDALLRNVLHVIGNTTLSQ